MTLVSTSEIGEQGRRVVKAAGAHPETHFSEGGGVARHYGAHEITLRLPDDPPGNPFDADVEVTFTPPSGESRAKRVAAFYDGGGVWRARTYLPEAGAWSWRSYAPGLPTLDGKAGTFIAVPSRLHGMLRVHPRDPRQFATDDGRWFLNLNDTAYKFFDAEQEEWQGYAAGLAALGVTSLRAMSLGGLGWDERPTGEGAEFGSGWPWQGADTSRFRLAPFQTTDARLRWLLDRHRDLQVQLILFGIRTWGKDDTGEAWVALPAAVRERTLRYMLARWAAFPNVFWLIANDLHYGPGFPKNSAMAEEIGEFFRKHDPWGHLLSTGRNRNEPFPFPDAPWATYFHLETANALGADEMAAYAGARRVPVFNGEDRYEQDRGAEVDPQNPRYFFRWLFWSWLLSGASASYGGRWAVLHPYATTGDRPWTVRGLPFSARLTGLDSVRPIAAYFEARKIELAGFTPDDALATDLDGRGGRRRPKLMRRDEADGAEEFLVYHPNAVSEGRTAAPAPGPARLRLDLSAFSGTYHVEWFRPEDGLSRPGSAVVAGKPCELAAPWPGHDAVLRLTRRPGSGRA